MSTSSLGTTSGAAVLLIGAIALGSVLYGVSGNEPPAVSSTSTTRQEVVVAAAPDVSGIPGPVQRVLYSSGKLEALGANQVSELRPEIARVLAYYGATLTVSQSSQATP
ncbi:MAG: hypothetical protein WBZ40_04965 [Acidimicrobiia bacterium]